MSDDMHDLVRIAKDQLDKEARNRERLQELEERSRQPGGWRHAMKAAGEREASEFRRNVTLPFVDLLKRHHRRRAVRVRALGDPGRRRLAFGQRTLLAWRLASGTTPSGDGDFPDSSWSVLVVEDGSICTTGEAPYLDLKREIAEYIARKGWVWPK